MSREGTDFSFVFPSLCCSRYDWSKSLLGYRQSAVGYRPESWRGAVACWPGADGRPPIAETGRPVLFSDSSRRQGRINRHGQRGSPISPPFTVVYGLSLARLRPTIKSGEESRGHRETLNHPSPID